MEVTREVHELPPGHRVRHGQLEPYYRLALRPPRFQSPEKAAAELRGRLNASVARCAGQGDLGAWLSGGLDSSAMAALARPLVPRLFTFVAGMAGAPDLEFAREVAAFIGSDHREVVVTLKEMVAALPDVIWHLESFDALLVRSSVTNYLVSARAAEFVPAVLSGEGGDELFAGYHYLKSLPPAELPAELVDIAGRLHNTALQRVDRSASAHGMIAHVGFLDPAVVECALEIPAEFKLRDGVEKWILRQALAGALPPRALERPKAKFWEGAGVGEGLARHAEAVVSDADFRSERELPNGWVINTKEELLYYRIFRERFGSLSSLDWMGRTKGAPRTA
jgi:asparagine synthase (glutamine-hydrolysing)